ncbi:hypothetical protein HDU96_011002 [Phlyctochytrium bullatum]|nr:hypothetical protein HDU96_011002 [Phlyctochytrium bullatum]
MSSDDSAATASSSTSAPSEPTTPAKNNFRWLPDRTRFFLQKLKEAVEDGKRADNGFKADAWHDVKNKMVAAFPPPHPVVQQLKNKYQNERKRWTIFNSLRGNSGFGVDNGTGLATAAPRVWDDLIRTKPEVAQFRFKALENLELLDFINTGIVATGEHAGMSADALIRELDAGPRMDGDVVDVEADGEANTVNPPTSSSSSNPGTVSEATPAASSSADAGPSNATVNLWDPPGYIDSDLENVDPATKPSVSKAKGAAAEPSTGKRPAVDSGGAGPSHKHKRKHQRVEAKLDETMDRLSSALEQVTSKPAPSKAGASSDKPTLQTVADFINELEGVQYLDAEDRLCTFSFEDCLEVIGAFRLRSFGEVVFDFCMVNMRTPLQQIKYIQQVVLKKENGPGIIDYDRSSAARVNGSNIGAKVSR